MRWFKPNLRNSLHAIFSTSAAPATESPAGHTVDDIRQQMLALLPDGDDEKLLALRRRMRYADDVEGLWFMRGELMGHIARRHGEARASEQIALLSEMFAGLLPSGLRSRPSPLQGRGGHEGDEEA